MALGADIHTVALNGATPIRAAAANGHNSTIKLLASLDADVTVS